MELWQCCRTCLSVHNLNPIFQLQEHHEKYAQVILEATGLKINMNDSLPQQMCRTCIKSTNEAYKFRRKCQESQKSLTEQINNSILDIKTEEAILSSEGLTSIDISNLIDVNDFVDVSITEYNIEFDDTNNHDIEIQKDLEKCEEKPRKKTKSKERCKPLKRTIRVRKSDKNKDKMEREKEEIECEYCHKILTSKLSLRNHYKIHTGFDVVCEHCGKKFITRRLLLMHCKAKHGYEKTDKCSYCDYRASNAEQVKIHERLHTGEKPYTCEQCGAGFHRKSSYLQHIAIHLPEKTVQCTQCPARFKSVTLMRIHANRHRATQYTYKCVVCAHNFARRRNVARHLLRIHSMQPSPEHIERSKCA